VQAAKQITAQMRFRKRFLTSLCLSATFALVICTKLYFACSRKLIINWTPRLQSWRYVPVTQAALSNCAYRCDVTNDTSRYLDADAILFHAADIKYTHLPRLRNPATRYVIYSRDSPHFRKALEPFSMPDFWNWSVTYRRNSDVMYDYGIGPEYWWTFKVRREKLDMVIAGKTRGAMWMVSHCNATSRRDEYVKKLRPFVEVRSFQVNLHPCPCPNVHEF
jgi:hypothetical protein